MSTTSLELLTRPFSPFVQQLGQDRPALVLCHSDGDGLAAGVLLVKALERAGYPAPVEVTRKGESAWSPAIAPRLAGHRPQALLVTDLGCRAEPILPNVPTVFIDHHRLEGTPQARP